VIFFLLSAGGPTFFFLRGTSPSREFFCHVGSPVPLFSSQGLSFFFFPSHGLADDVDAHSPFPPLGQHVDQRPVTAALFFFLVRKTGFLFSPPCQGRVPLFFLRWDRKVVSLFAPFSMIGRAVHEGLIFFFWPATPGPAPMVSIS